MGRRPGIKNGVTSGLSLTQMSPEVKEKLNDIALLVFTEFEKRIKDKIKGDAFKVLDVKELMDTFNKTLRAIQGPATSMQQINVPQAPQIQPGGEPRAAQVADAVEDPAKIEKLRERQQAYLEKHGG